MLPYAPWLVWILPVFSSIFIPLIAYFREKARIEYFTIMVCAVSFLLAFSMTPDIYLDSSEGYSLTMLWIPSLNINLNVYVDSLSVLLSCLVSFFGLIVLVYSLGYMAGEEGLTRYYFFMLLFIGGMIGLVLSGNFLQLFIFWELVGLSSYSLISFWYKRPETVRSAIKVFLMTRIGDVCLLAGICILYMNIGSFSFDAISSNVWKIPISPLTASAFLMLIGAVAKSAQLPFHTWLYSAMEAPTSVSALLHSATMVKAGVYLIARLICLFGPISSLIPMWLTSTMWIGAVTAFIGAILALSTTDIKGVAAYSTISQIGFMFAALGTATSTASLGWFASILHLISHALFQALDFFLIGGIIHVTRTRDMRLMGGLRKAMPTTFAFSIVVLLMRAGIPPFVSFFSKELIFQSVLSSGNLYAALLLYVSTAATFAYTLRAITLIYGGEESAYLKQLHLHEAPKIMLLSSGVLAALCIFTAPLGNLFPHLMHINMKMDLSEVLNPLISIFLLTLIAGGLSIYFAYYREVKMGRNIGQIFVLNKILENGFFFDIFYERKIAQGVLACSSVLRHIEKEVFGRLPHILASKITACSSVLRHIEKEVFGRLPHILASKITALAYGVQRYFDALLDRLLYVGVSKTLTSTSKIRRGEPKSMKHYIAAILIGFLLIFILTIIILH